MKATTLQSMVIGIAMITNFFISELNNHDVQELWFQQDGATCHTARATIDLLEDTFGDRLISRFGPVNRPPRSCDLTPQDYFLWSYVKSLVYADKPQTLDHLEDNIRRVIADIRPQMLEKVVENWTSRLDYIRASRGRSFGMREKGGNHLVPIPDCMVDALKLTNQAPRGYGELLQKYVFWRCFDGTQHLFFWPILVISGQSLASNDSVVDIRDLNLVFGLWEATPNN
ncbi:DUF4817 domain-containing protein [Trichonephila clavipes]|nr:DUF4817 domain-containing protein [Trichonephila clavipes]